MSIIASDVNIITIVILFLTHTLTTHKAHYIINNTMLIIISD
jgi:hypothetical protein